MSNQRILRKIRIGLTAGIILCGVLWGSATTSGNVIITILAVLFSIILLFLLFFFRDPERKSPAGENNIVSPCDGKVIAIDPCPVEVLGVPGRTVSIFMSIFNVHVNRNVCYGDILEVEHIPGSFGHAGKSRASLQNERNRILIENHQFRVQVIQIAGMLAGRIICQLTPGDSIKKGERFGMIILGSRLEVTLPNTIKISTTIGQNVRAGETIIGEYHP